MNRRLIQLGFVLRTARGGVATRTAYKNFGLKVPARATATLELFKTE